MSVVRVQNPNVLKDPNFKDFLLEAKARSFYRDMPDEQFLADMAQIVVDPAAYVHLAVADGQYRGLAISFLPQGPLALYPRVAFFYMRKGKNWGLKKALVQALVDNLKENHYTQGWAINATGVPDSVYKRAFRQAGKITRIGSVVQFQPA